MNTVFGGGERIGVYYSARQVTTLPGTLAVYAWNSEGFIRDGFIADPERIGERLSDCLASVFAVAGEFMRQIVTPRLRASNMDQETGFSKPGYVIVKASKGAQPASDPRLGQMMASFSLEAILDSKRGEPRDDDFVVSTELSEANSTSLMLLFMMLASHLSVASKVEGSSK